MAAAAGASGGAAAQLMGGFLPAVAQMTSILLLGYVSSRTKLITAPQLSGMSKFVGTFCLPAMLFRTLATLDLGSVDVVFVAAIFLSKVTVFVCVLGLTFLLDHRLKGPARFVEGGLRGILATQSNDFALGLPILRVLYSTSHPSFPLLLYVIAPISLVLINPIAFCLCEYGFALLPPSPPDPLTATLRTTLGRSHRANSLLASRAARAASLSRNNSGASPIRTTPTAAQQRSRGRSNANNPPPPSAPPIANMSKSAPPPASRYLAIMCQVARNPVVGLTLLGMLWNVACGGYLPSFMGDLLGAFAGLFPVSAIWMMGVNMYRTVDLSAQREGSGSGSQDSQDLATYCVIVIAKLLAMPPISYAYVRLLGGPSDLAQLAFILGTLPVAPTVSIYALRYSTPSKNYVSQLSAATVLSTVVGVPILLMLVLAITLVDAQPSSLPSLIAELCRYLAWPGLLGCIWLITSFTLSGRGLRSPSRDLYLLIWATGLRCLLTLLPCPAALLLLPSLAQRTLTLHLSLTTLLRRRFGPTALSRLWPRLSLACLCSTLLSLLLCLLLLPPHLSQDPLSSVPLLLPRLSPIVLSLSLPSFLLLLALLLLLSGLRLPASFCALGLALTRGGPTAATGGGKQRDTGLNTNSNFNQSSNSNGPLAIITSAEGGDTTNNNNNHNNSSNRVALEQGEGRGGEGSPMATSMSMGMGMGQELGASGKSLPPQPDLRTTLTRSGLSSGDVLGVRVVLLCCFHLLLILLSCLRCVLENEASSSIDEARLLPFFEAGVDMLQGTAVFLLWGLERRQPLLVLLKWARARLLSSCRCPSDHLMGLQQHGPLHFEMPSIDILHLHHKQQQVLRRQKTLSRAGLEPVGCYNDWMDDHSSQDSSPSSSSPSSQDDDTPQGQDGGIGGDRTPPLQRLDEEEALGESEGQGEGDGFDAHVHMAPLPEDPTRPATPPCYWDSNNN